MIRFNADVMFLTSHHSLKRWCTSNPASASHSVDELVKGRGEQDEDQSSSFTTCQVPELPMRRYLQDADFIKREFLVDTPAVSVAMKSTENAQLAKFSDQQENSTASQLTWQDKIETSDYMTLIRRPDDSETSDYMTIVRRRKDSETSYYMTIVRRRKDSETSDYMRRPKDSETRCQNKTIVRKSKDSNSFYQSPSTSGKLDEWLPSTENTCTIATEPLKEDTT